MDDPYLEGIEAKFQRDPLRGFGGRGIYNVDNGSAYETIYGPHDDWHIWQLLYFHSLCSTTSRTHFAWQPHIKPSPKFLVYHVLQTTTLQTGRPGWGEHNLWTRTL